MRFDWPQFLTRNRIDYVTSGPNVARGKIAIRCPWCGQADPSQHMAITLTTGAWKCWRNREHRGLQPTRLVATLLRCDLDQAKALVYGEGSVQLPDDFLSRVNGVLSPQTVQHSSKTKLTMPREFLPFKDLPSARPFIQYLIGRGFDIGTIFSLTKDYGIRYANYGPFESRIILPVHFDGQLVNWTARTISRRERLRYKTLSVEYDNRGAPAAVGPISNYLLWYDQLTSWSRDTLVLCEGPFDALKLNILGRQHGIAATCVFTSRPTRSQVDLLHELVPKYKRCILMLDADMQAIAFRVGAELSSLHVEVRQLPRGVKDPAELNASHLAQLF
jgi:hypothetical protein